MDGSGGAPWIDPTPAGQAVRAIVFLLFVGAGALTAWTLVDIARRNGARIVHAGRKLLGNPEQPSWAPGDWPCARCRSVNRSGTSRCARCRGPRDEVELRLPAPEREPDIIPGEIRSGPDALVILEHHDDAHVRALSGHWLLKVNGVVAGSAATRDGAAALLAALQDTPMVMADPKGQGYAQYATASLIAAFTAGPLPYTGACPEQTRGPTSPR
jgi:hypothetical protein